MLISRSIKKFLKIYRPELSKNAEKIKIFYLFCMQEFFISNFWFWTFCNFWMVS
jgi:hypothetical protein